MAWTRNSLAGGGPRSGRYQTSRIGQTPAGEAPSPSRLSAAGFTPAGPRAQRTLRSPRSSQPSDVAVKINADFLLARAAQMVFVAAHGSTQDPPHRRRRPGPSRGDRRAAAGRGLRDAGSGG